MRKNVIALMLVLPLLFVFVIFGAGKIGSLGAAPAVSDVIIRNKPVSGTQTVELLDYNDSYEVFVEILPLAARQECIFSYEKPDGTVYGEEEEVPVHMEAVEDNPGAYRVVADTVGLTVIRALSRDGSKSDSFIFNVISSRAYDYDVVLTKEGAEGNFVVRDGGDFRGTVEPGRYSFAASMRPASSSFTTPRVLNATGNVIIDEAKGELLLPYAGETVSFDLFVAGLPEETATKHVELKVDFDGAAPSAKPVLINGEGVEEDTPVELTVGRYGDESDNITATSTVYLQTWFGDVLSFDPSEGLEVTPEKTVTEGYYNYKLSLLFTDTVNFREPELVIRLAPSETARQGSDTVVIKFVFETFSFKLRANLGDSSAVFENAAELPSQALLLNTEMSFSAMPDVPLDGVFYRWELLTENFGLMTEAEYPDGFPLELTYGEDDAGKTICNVKAVSKVSRVILRVQAMLNADGEERSLYMVRVIVEVMENILALELADTPMMAQVARSDGKVLTVPGYHYENRQIVSDPNFAIDIRAAKGFSGSGGDGTVNTDTTIDVRNLVFGEVSVKRTEEGETTVRTMDVEQLERSEGLSLTFGNAADPVTGRVKQQLIITMHNAWRPAEVTIPVEWAGNESFGRDIRTSVTLNLVKNAVLVQTSEQLFDVTENQINYAIVLGADIMLGMAANGSMLSVEERESILARHTMYSTYNTAFYRNNGNTAAAYVHYVVEFKQSVYGNGYTLNAEYFTNAKDGTGQARFFKGPLDFVRYAGIAYVAGQDNIAFLCRTDGVTIYNTILLGCSDSSLEDGSGAYDLTKLNNVGTTLEINADVSLLNCRVRNGRNVVRVYGGNRDAGEEAEGYFFGDFAHRADYADKVRITVRIDGCVLSYAREFILKMGSNVALLADTEAEPALLDANDEAYVSNDPGRYLGDDYFYHTYVTTELTLKDSVLDTSGLFTVGVESNFAGLILTKTDEFGFTGAFEGAKSWPGTGGTSFAPLLRLEGDVRLYDWKDLSRVDSSTLISVLEGAGEIGGWLKLDIAAMLDFVKNSHAEYGGILDDEGHVHGGIAVYGGGRNYAQVDLSGLSEARSDLHRYAINISVLADSPDELLSRQGQLLPLAAGTQDFYFYMYDKDSANSYAAQEGESADRSVKPVAAF